MTTMCPTFRAAVNTVLDKHTTRHFMDGGKGVCCYVWVSGPAITPKGNPSKKLVKACFLNSRTFSSGRRAYGRTQ